MAIKPPSGILILIQSAHSSISAIFIRFYKPIQYIEVTVVLPHLGGIEIAVAQWAFGSEVAVAQWTFGSKAKVALRA